MASWSELSERERDALVAVHVMGADPESVAVLPRHDWERRPDGTINMSAWMSDEYPDSGPRCRRCGDMPHAPKYGETLEVGPCEPHVTNYTGTFPDYAPRMKEALEARRLQAAYLIALFDVLGLDNTPLKPMGARSLWMLVHATPEQRCLAALRAVGVEVTP